MIPKVSIHIITFNSQRFIKSCLDSIFSQTFQDFSVLIIDNASRDDTVAFIRERYNKQFIKQQFNSAAPLFVIHNPQNTGFSRAHNQGIILSKSEFILVMNPDMILEPNFLKQVIHAILKDKNIASVGGKLLRMKLDDQNNKYQLDDKKKTREDLPPLWLQDDLWAVKTTTIDTTGMDILKSRRVKNRGEGEKDINQYDKNIYVFGISGACALYRRSALEDIKIPVRKSRGSTSLYEYFDEDFFAYQEDIDLSWRLQLRGWRARYVPNALGHHFRIGAPVGKRLSQSKMVNYLSYRNHLWTLLKNSYWSNFLSHCIYIFFYQLIKELYLFFTQPIVLFKASASFWAGFSKIYKKRKYIMRNAKVTSSEIKKWFTL